ncbi:MAG: TIGR04211 family SH3 domain-containing protein [Deferrisomatales bacterium]|nr:TIGR04211 family SH3 domain-containing protein [Deferrisomatales bacterium]
MTRTTLGLAALLVAAFLVPAAAGAETRYITDVLLVNLRARPQAGAETIRLLRSGEVLEVMGSEAGFLRVRTEQGEEGWVAEQYAVTDVPKEWVVAELREEVERLRARVLTLEGARDEATAELEAARKAHASSATALQQELSELREQAEGASRELREVRREYESLLQASGQVGEVVGERDRLRAENRELTEALARREAQARSLGQTRALRWFLAGAGVLLVGWVLGALTRKKKARFSVG